MKKLLFLLCLFAVSSCDFIDKAKSKIFTGEKQKLFLIASDQEVDINQFNVKKKLYQDVYLTDVGYIVYTGIGKVKKTYSFTKENNIYNDIQDDNISQKSLMCNYKDKKSGYSKKNRTS